MTPTGPASPGADPRSFERVYTMTDYYDGPRRGIASFEGKPHFYDSEWSDGKDLEADTFKLTPVAEDLLLLAMEDWALWERWETAFHEGRVDTTTHPALPEDRARHNELQPVLSSRLATDPEHCVRAHGEFRSAKAGPYDRGRERQSPTVPLEVRWERC